MGTRAVEELTVAVDADGAVTIAIDGVAIGPPRRARLARAAASPAARLHVEHAHRLEGDAGGEALASALAAAATDAGRALTDALAPAGHGARAWIDRRSCGPRRVVVALGPATRAVPWEMLTARGWALADRGVALVREVPRRAPAADPPVARPLRVLLAEPRPRGLPWLAQGGAAAIDDAVARGAPIVVTRIPRATLGRIEQAARDARARGEPFDVVHVDGHGDAGDSPSIAFEDDRGDLAPAPAGAIAGAIGDAPLVVLEVCRSADVDAAGGPALVEAVVRAGARAAIGFHHLAHVDATSLFACALHAALARGAPIERAVVAGRRRLGAMALRRGDLAGSRLARVLDAFVPVLVAAEGAAARALVLRCPRPGAPRRIAIADDAAPPAPAPPAAGEAERDAEEAARMEIDGARDLRSDGRREAARERVLDAIDLLRGAPRAFATRAAAYFELAELERLRGDVEAAGRATRVAAIALDLVVDPGPALLAASGAARLAEGDASSAVALLVEAWRAGASDPTVAPAIAAHLVDALRAAGLAAPAVAFADEALRAHAAAAAPRDAARLVSARAHALRDLGALGAAIEGLERARELATRAGLPRAAASLAEVASAWREAAATLAELAATPPG